MTSTSWASLAEFLPAFSASLSVIISKVKVSFPMLSPSGRVNILSSFVSASLSANVVIFCRIIFALFSGLSEPIGELDTINISVSEKSTGKSVCGLVASGVDAGTASASALVVGNAAFILVNSVGFSTAGSACLTTGC